MKTEDKNFLKIDGFRKFQRNLNFSLLNFFPKKFELFPFFPPKRPIYHFPEYKKVLKAETVWPKPRSIQCSKTIKTRDFSELNIEVETLTQHYYFRGKEQHKNWLPVITQKLGDSPDIDTIADKMLI